jgi:ankyrin repeat protein
MELFDAVRSGSLDEVRRVLRTADDDFDIDAFDADGMTALAYATDVEIVQYLLDQGADVHLKSYLKHAPSAEIVECLVRAGACVDRTNYRGATALMFSTGNLGKVRALLRAGANVNARDVNGTTALMRAVSCAYVDIRVVRALLDAGADVHAADDHGFTALMLARDLLRDANPEVVLLLEQAEATS